MIRNRRNSFMMKCRKPLLILCVGVLALCVYMNRRKISIIVTNTYQSKPESHHHRGVDSIEGELRKWQLSEIGGEVGDIVDGENGKTCKRVWEKGSSSWFDAQYVESISPVWSRGNMVLKDEVRKWWLSIHDDGDRNVTSLLNSLFKIIPDVDPYQQRNTKRCVKCAVVGSSGNLRNSKYGKLIDSHHRIIRVNYAPMKGYEEDVGSRETHRLAYPVTYTDVQKDAHFVLVPFGAKDIDWLISALTDGKITWTYSPVPRYIDVDRSQVLIFNPALMYDAKSSWMKEEKRWPSTGFLMILFAFHICDEVNVFGFGASSYGAWDHYWEPDAGPWNYIYRIFLSPHKESAETAILDKWAEEGKIKIYKGVR